jgi:1-acyl-sn-glycerol-3-phosphate acyltransferase
MLFEGRRKPGEMSRRYRLFRRAMTLLCRFLFGYRVHGGDRAPSDGPLIVASNHSQYADPVLVCVAVPRRLQWMAKKQLFVFPFRKFFEFIGSFPVDREGGGKGAIRAALAFLAEGWALGIFPEGTHRGAGASREAKSGVVVLALRLRGRRLHIFVGEPVDLDQAMRGGAAYRAAADEIMHTIYALPERHAQESL